MRRKCDCKEEMQMEPCGMVLFFFFGVVFEERAGDVCFETFVARAVSLGVCMPQCEKKHGTGGCCLVWLKEAVRGQWVDHILSGELWDSGAWVCPQKGDFYSLANQSKQVR